MPPDYLSTWPVLIPPENRETSGIYNGNNLIKETIMITTFTLLALAGGALRVALNWVLRRYFGLSLSFPQGLAGVLLLLAVLPDIITPIDINLPLGLVVGLLLPDLLFRRAW
jgi:hypothetical protein